MTYLAAAGLVLAGLTGSEEKQVFDPGNITSNLVVFTETSVALADRKLTEIKIGDLPLPDGRLVALDPLVRPDSKPFVRTVKAGTYPVSFIRGVDKSARPALLVIRFSDAKVERFELATVDGQDIGKLEDDTFFGIGVDAGIAGFANAAYSEAQSRFQLAEQEKPGSEYSNYYDDVISFAIPGKGGDEFVLDRPFKDEDGAAAMTQAGWGDGFYPTFWGLDKDGKPALAFIEFFVITDGDGRTDLEKESGAIASKMTERQQADNRAAYSALETGDEATVVMLLKEGRISAKNYVLDRGGSFMLRAILLDRPAVLRTMVDAGADDAPGPHDASMRETYSKFARGIMDYAEKAKAEGKSQPALRSPELMAVIAELEKRPGSPDQPK